MQTTAATAGYQFRDSRLSSPGEPFGAWVGHIFTNCCAYCHIPIVTARIASLVHASGQRSSNGGYGIPVTPWPSFAYPPRTSLPPFCPAEVCWMGPMHVCEWMRASFHTTQHFPSLRSVCLFLPFSFLSRTVVQLTFFLGVLSFFLFD